MKKYILFIIIPVLFLFNNKIYADTYVPTFVGTIEGCNISSSRYFSSSDDRIIYIFRLDNYTYGTDISFIYYTNGNNSNPINGVASSELLSTCSSSRFPFWAVSPAAATDNQSFTVNISTSYSSYSYLYISIRNEGQSISWLTTPPTDPPYEYPFTNSIYIPDHDTYNKCYVVQNEDVIRAYDVVPALSTDYNYRDYYINSDYIYKDGSGSWSQYSILPICLDNNIITHNFYYRVDFYKSLIIFFIISIFSIYLPIKLFSKIFRKGVL